MGIPIEGQLTLFRRCGSAAVHKPFAQEQATADDKNLDVLLRLGCKLADYAAVPQEPCCQMQRAQLDRVTFQASPAPALGQGQHSMPQRSRERRSQRRAWLRSGDCSRQKA